jgi:hypothetical protein
MKSCPNCRSVFEDTQKFCSFDGATLNTIAPESSNSLPPTVAVNVPPAQAFSPPQLTPNQPLNHSMATPKKSRKGLYFLLGGAGVLFGLAIILVGGFFFLTWFSACCGYDQNTNTDKVKITTPTPAAVVEDFKQPADTFLPKTAVGGFLPGDMWDKKNLNDSLETFYTPLKNSLQDFAARQFFREEPDIQISLVILKYPSAQAALSNCQTLQKAVSRLDESRKNIDEYRIVRAQMPTGNRASPETNSAPRGCGTAFVQKTKTINMTTIAAANRNLIFLLSGKESDSAEIQKFSRDFGNWFRENYIAQKRSTTENTTNLAATTLDAKELFNAYKSDSAAAESKYKGKTVKVSGTIGASGTDVAGTVFALFEAGDNAYFVRCVFPESMKSEVSALPKNQTAVLQGTIEGKVYGDVKLSGCSIAK